MQTPALHLDQSAREIVLNPAVFPLLEGWNYVSLHYDSQTNNIAITRQHGRAASKTSKNSADSAAYA